MLASSLWLPVGFKAQRFEANKVEFARGYFHLRTSQGRATASIQLTTFTMEGVQYASFRTQTPMKIGDMPVGLATMTC